jgi:hypothetical protein
MQDGSVQYTSDKDRARALFAPDPIAFLTQCLAIAVLVPMCWTEAQDARFFVMSLVF